MKLIGKGLVVDAEHGVDFPDYGDLELNFGLNVLTIPAPATTGSYIVPYDAPITGRISWYDLGPELLAAATGNDLTAGTVKRAAGEAHAIPAAAPYEVTLDHAPPLALSDLVVGDDGRRFKRAAGAPGAGEYAVAGAVFTFNAADAGRAVYADYFYADAAAGQTLVVSPFALPGEFKLLAGLKLYGTGANEYEGDLVFAAERCRRTGPLAVGSRVGQFGSFGFEFAVENRVPGDVAVYFP
jgi:hypothetical protein